MKKHHFLSLFLLFFISVGHSQTTITLTKEKGNNIEKKVMVSDDNKEVDALVESMKLPNKIEKEVLQDIKQNYLEGRNYVWETTDGKTSYKVEIGDQESVAQIERFEIPGIIDLDFNDKNVFVIDNSQAYLGLGFEAFDFKNDSRTDVRGVIVKEIVEGESAFNAGLEEGDVITAINGVSTPSPSLFKDAISELKPRDEIVFTINRDGKEHQLNSVVGKKESSFNWMENGGNGVEHPFFQMDLEKMLQGFNVEDLQGRLKGLDFNMEDLEQQLQDLDFEGLFGLNGMVNMDKPKLGVGIENSEDGVVVDLVEKDSAAEKAGIETGDIIKKINGVEVEVVDDLIDAVQDIEMGKKVDIVVERDGKTKKLKTEFQKRKIRKVIIKGQEG